MNILVKGKFPKEQILREFKRQMDHSGQTLVVGILADHNARPKDKKGGMTNAEIGMIHEFGVPSRGIPQRSFLRATLDSQKHELFNLLAHQLPKKSGSINVVGILKVVGAWLVGQVQKRMSQGIPPALQPATVAAKGSSKPLINTGQLRSSISYEVHK